ncbi:uncharacterized protein A4U43_C10F10430 [Asparagus officinalis]|uniref:Uncharacterized protein n=1 Tax=Asparagus officinalis TaxID=4686 RepID=A0A5P1E2B6_ASPOF|nr:uncharacterized protein LOC109825804 [Asparagus officinalis]ONK56589.1 uncharacterized protein A4U43_C10F10430 [Asparagus officinalis]
MDVLALNLKSGSLFLGTKSVRALEDERIRVSEVVVRRVSFGYRSLVVKATGKKKNHGNDDPSVPEGDSPESVNPASDELKSDASTPKSQHPLLDWRDFRANLVIRKHELLDSADSPDGAVSHKPPSQKLGLKWAHPIPVPEPGCVLVATERLDGVRSFERTVVLLLRLGTRDPREGPFGVIINRPLHKKIKHMNPSNTELATTFSDCALHFGGPLDTSMFLIKTSESSSLPGFEQVVPGICFGSRNSLDEAAELVKKGMLRAEDFRFFVGYAGWQLDQLKEEIAQDYWVVAACSSHLIGGGASVDDSSGLWEEILQLMGGQYSELSRKPKKDSS